MGKCVQYIIYSLSYRRLVNKLINKYGNVINMYRVRIPIDHELTCIIFGARDATFLERALLCVHE